MARLWVSCAVMSEELGDTSVGDLADVFVVDDHRGNPSGTVRRVGGCAVHRAARPPISDRAELYVQGSPYRGGAHGVLAAHAENGDAIGEMAASRGRVCGSA